MISCEIEKTLRAPGGEMKLRLELEFKKGELVTLYGESGAGKTSTLRILAGLLTPDRGRITVGGRTWFDSEKKINLKPQQRNLGFVFQDYALFPHMTVRENLEYGTRSREDKGLVSNLIEMVALDDLQDRRPETLSGGQKQRVALARALVGKPELLLLDEPLSALDAKIRTRLQDAILALHREFALTTLLISHDLGEIHKLSDHVVELEQGTVLRQGSAEELFLRNKISGKFRFTGQVLNIEATGVVHIVTVLIQNQLVKVVAQEKEIRDLVVGDRVLVASKAFNPVLQKLDS
ncbi:MAG: ATP-binding cassette domain-containing protein [Bacteroidetes bacterium]|nr:MAG: ATP-binding cassette domain-containing protein [Bacteroidota bacterium]UCE69365.1 MAG: ATP-binding cassette domain-containing protein [Flavobacteriaceae bacterium]